jgi:hypothetical protein
MLAQSVISLVGSDGVVPVASVDVTPDGFTIVLGIRCHIGHGSLYLGSEAFVLDACDDFLTCLGARVSQRGTDDAMTGLDAIEHAHKWLDIGYPDSGVTSEDLLVGVRCDNALCQSHNLMGVALALDETVLVN